MTTMRLRDPLLFLFGVRSSIERVIRCPRAIWMSLALVATAAISREYDAVSWLHHPQDLLAPFGASLLIGSIVFVFVMIGLASSGRRSWNLWHDYRLFMTGYWMTAPLAWLYAFPIEIMTEELTALKFNLAMLSIVSIWRVLLFSRVIAIQFAVPMLAVLPMVLLPCMMIAFVALLSATLSMVSLMGGIRLTQTQQMLMDFQSNVLAICFYGVIPILILTSVAIGILHRRHHYVNELRPLDGKIRRRASVATIVAACLLLAGASLFQPGLYRAAEVDTLLQNDQVVEAIEKMQDDGRDAFPIVWDPPPCFPHGYSQTPAIADLVAGIEATKCQPWIVEKLLVQADEIALRQVGWYQGIRELDYLQLHFPQHTPVDAETAIENLSELQRINAGDEATITHRAALLETLEKVRLQAELNAAESNQHSDLYEDTDADTPQDPSD